MNRLHDIDHLIAVRTDEQESKKRQYANGNKVINNYQKSIRPLLSDFVSKRIKLGYVFEQSFKENTNIEVRFMRVGNQASGLFAVTKDLKLYKTNAKTLEQPHVAIRELAGPLDISYDQLVENLNHGLMQSARQVPDPRPSFLDKFRKLDRREKTGLVLRVVLWSFAGTAIGGLIAETVTNHQETLFLNLGCFGGGFIGFMMWRNWRK